MRKLVLNLLKSDQQLVAVRYFTSRVSSSTFDLDQAKRQGSYIEALETLPETTLHFGHYLNKTVKCFKCGNQWLKPEEKMTDVNIAIALIDDAFKDRFDTALLISGDSDLVGAVLQVKNLCPKKRVVVAFPPARSSARLKTEAQASFVISRKTLKDSQLPDTVTKSDGFILTRPERWK